MNNSFFDSDYERIIERNIYNIERSSLFAGIGRDDIIDYLKESNAKIGKFRKDEMIFLQDDMPEYLNMLIGGSVAVCNDSGDGKRCIIAQIEQPGDLFGEVILFLNHQEYEHYALAMQDSLVLQIPRKNFFDTRHGNMEVKARITANLLSIFANKSYYLNQRLNILLCGNLRQKLTKIILKDAVDGVLKLKMNREELADFVNTARPSLSRELMSMQEDGLIRVEKRNLYIVDENGLRALL